MLDTEKVKIIEYTHKGWFGICPVYIAELEHEMPIIAPRWGYLEWLLDISTGLFSFYFKLRTLIDMYYDPQWEISKITELPFIIKVEARE